MTSPARLHYGQTYHIYNRGNNREDIFFQRRNYLHFLKLYAKYVVPAADTFAYCLLPNHFHLLVRIKTEQELLDGDKTLGVSETPRVSRAPKVSPGVSLNPSQQFGNLFNAYAKAINKACARTGSLFQNPFGRVLVTEDAHFLHLIGYIHRNPEKHGLVNDFRTWPHSSYHAILSDRPTRLRREEVLAWFGDLTAFQRFHQQSAAEALLAKLAPDDPD